MSNPTAIDASTIRGQVKAVEYDAEAYAKTQSKADLEEKAAIVGAEATGTKTEIAQAIIDKFPKPDPSLRGKSTIESPVALVWVTCDEMTAADPEVRRKDLMAACQEQGVAYYTARTQIQAWKKHTNGRRLAEVEDLPRSVDAIVNPAEEGAEDAA